MRSKYDWNKKKLRTEQTNTCSKTTIKTLEQDAK